MNLFTLYLQRAKTRSLTSLLRRSASVFKRYGNDPDKFTAYIEGFADLLSSYGVNPTFPVPGAIVEKYPDLFKRFQDRGVEFAAHGLVHIDYSMLNEEKFSVHLDKINEIFDKNGILCVGFRFPFFRKSRKFKKILSESGFLWDSSDVVSFPIDESKFGKKDVSNYRRIVESYKPLTYNRVSIVPSITDGIVELPAVVPDDDILIERLGINSADDPRMGIWLQMLKKINEHSGLMVLQAHPERFLNFEKPIAQLIAEATADSNIWVTSMNKVAQWWKDRSRCKVYLQKDGRSRYRIIVKGDKRITVLIKNLNTSRNDILYKPVYSPVKDTTFVIKCKKKPIIGIHPGTDTEHKKYLSDQGFVWEESVQNENYCLYFREYREFKENDKLKIMSEIEKCPDQLVRIWKWPEGKRSAFTVTGDIDGLTRQEIWMRNYGKRRKYKT